MGQRLFQPAQHEDVFAVVGEQFIEEALVVGCFIVLPGGVGPLAIFAR